MVKSLSLVTTYLGEVRDELKKVVWPTRGETLKLTAIVVGASIVVGIYIGLLDVTFTKLVNTFILR